MNGTFWTLFALVVLALIGAWRVVEFLTDFTCQIIARDADAEDHNEYAIVIPPRYRKPSTRASVVNAQRFDQRRRLNATIAIGGRH